MVKRMGRTMNKLASATTTIFPPSSRNSSAGGEAHKPAEQQVVVERLQQQPLGADPIERLQQRGQQQLLRWNRWSSF